MSNKRIVWQSASGGVDVFVPADESRADDEDEEDWLARLAAKAVPRGTVSRVLDVEELPTSRKFRNAWRVLRGSVAVDLDAARQQLLEEIRVERNRRLLDSDAERARLEDMGTAAQRRKLKLYRQALRDVPAVVELELNRIDELLELEAYRPSWPI